jgi:hypothetical protein
VREYLPDDDGVFDGRDHTHAADSGLSAFLNSAYTRVATTIVADGVCNTIDVSCDTVSDFLLSCGAAVDLTTGYLTASTEIPGANGTCRAGGCGFGGTTSVAVTATCLRP